MLHFSLSQYSCPTSGLDPGLCVLVRQSLVVLPLCMGRSGWQTAGR